MKNFPHQFNNLEKLFRALAIAKQLIEKNLPLTDDIFGERLTRERIYTYRDKTLSIDQFLEKEKHKPRGKRGHLTAARDMRRFLELLDFIYVLDNDKNSRITTKGSRLLSASSEEYAKQLWKDAFLQLELEGEGGRISHPYRILLKIVNTFPGIETKKLMLALEGRDDSEEEFERISSLAKLNIDQVIQRIGTSKSMAKNAVKILPGIAEQLNDIQRISNRAYPVGHLFVTEDEISTEEEPEVPRRERADFREVSAVDIAKDPTIKLVSSVSIDIADAIKTRQKRLTEHQEIVRLLAILNEKFGIQLFEGKFDCLGIKGDRALLYEVKTILESATDQEKQTVKGVGQLKYYKFSIAQKKEELSDIREILVFSRKPDVGIIDFCKAESIAVIWREGDSFQIFNIRTGGDDSFKPDEVL